MRRCFSELLRYPEIGGNLVTPTWITLRELPFDDEEGKERSKEEIGDL